MHAGNRKNQCKAGWTTHSLIRMSIPLFLGTFAVSCGGEDNIPCCDAEVTDPYCVDTPDWYEEVDVSAAFDKSDPSLLIVSLEPTNDIVDMNGYVDVEGADVESLVFPDHELWLVLKTSPEYDTIRVQGAVDCTTETKGYLLTISIGPDGDVTYEISYTIISDADGGDVDAGDTDTSK